ncbi:hypothetical protein AM228_11195 [Planktothricoides sp. SR001]|nr:hypothetical protein AM228_11195 [Planktothricoides sp. SR001]
MKATTRQGINSLSNGDLPLKRTLWENKFPTGFATKTFVAIVESRFQLKSCTSCNNRRRLKPIPNISVGFNRL